MKNGCSASWAPTPGTSATTSIPSESERLRLRLTLLVLIRRGRVLGPGAQCALAVAGYWELDDEQVLLPTRYSGRGKVSRMDIEGRGVILFQVREGKVTRVVRDWDPERALADLGLLPRDDAAASA